jgi:hypothetical protein
MTSNVESPAPYRCKEKRKRRSQQNKVLKKELPRCCRDRQKSACGRFCYTRRMLRKNEPTRAKQTSLMCRLQRRIPLDINPIGSARRYMAG